MGSFLKEIFELFFGPDRPDRPDRPGRQRSPTPTVETELGGPAQAHSKPSRSTTDSYSDLLKQATALKREGDIDGSLARIDRAIAIARPGDGGRPPAQKKRIYYLLLAKRTGEALETANQIVAEAHREARGDKALIGTCYSFGYQERARVLLAMKKSTEAFMDYVRAAWHWHHAMRLQGRTRDEHTPEKAVEGLLGEAARCKVSVSDPVQFKKAALEGLKGPSSDSMTDRLHPLIGRPK